MSLERLEREVLKSKPDSRAKLAENLLESLENLSEEENESGRKMLCAAMKKSILAPSRLVQEKRCFAAPVLACDEPRLFAPPTAEEELNEVAVYYEAESEGCGTARSWCVDSRTILCTRSLRKRFESLPSRVRSDGPSIAVGGGDTCDRPET